MVLVRDEQAFDAIDAGRSFAQLRETDMTTATMDEILRQNNLGLRETFEARLAGDRKRSDEKLKDRVAEVDRNMLAGANIKRALGPECENTGVMVSSHALRREINGHTDRDRAPRRCTDSDALTPRERSRIKCARQF